MYHKWENMKQRCLNPNHPSYRNYGGRGISVCEDWLTFNNFKSWCENNGYSEELELDRINNDGNYEPCNCRFISHVENNNNKRMNVKYTFEGKEYTLRELSSIVKIHHTTLRTRLFRGMTLEESINTPIRKGGRYNAEYYEKD
jgi:hypothetical protein